MGPNWQRVLEALHSNQRVRGLTHDYYNYPARFDPKFVRTVIEECTEDNDVVLDPYMGGGTSIVEAVASGRRSMGFDVNPLSCFLAAAKTTPLSRRDIEAIRRWADRLGDELANFEPGVKHHSNVQLLNVQEPISCILTHAAESVRVLEFPRRRRFARCVLLRWGQWAIDGRRDSPDLETMRTRVIGLTEVMLSGLMAFTDTATGNGVAKAALTGRRNIYRGSAALLPKRVCRKLDGKAKLVLTVVNQQKWDGSGPARITAMESRR